METILLHMMLLLDDSIPCHDTTLLDELVYDANLDVVHDPNSHDEVAHDATLLLIVLSNVDPNSLMGSSR